MKKLFLIFCLLAAVATLVCMPAFAEEISIDDKTEEETTVLSFYNLTMQSGVVLRSFQLELRDEILSSNGQPNPEVALKLQQLADSLNIALSGTYEVKYENSVLSVTVQYDSLTDLYIAMGETGFDYEPSNNEETKGFFFNSYKTTMTTVWQSAGDPNTVPGFLRQAALIVGESEENITYLYVYGTKFRPSAISSDADGIEKINGIYMHQFIMDKDSLDREINLIQNSPNPTGWYIVAIGVGCVIAAAFVVYAIYKNKKEGK